MLPIAPQYQSVVVAQNYVRLTASGLVKAGEGFLAGVILASGTTPTLQFWDNVQGVGLILINTTIPTVGWNPFPIHFTNGLFVTITGTVDCTVTFN